MAWQGTRAVAFAKVKLYWLAALLLFVWSPESKATGLSVGAPEILFVLDATPSMYGELGSTKTSKWEMAKSIIIQAMASWPKNLPVGLAVFGHDGRAGVEIILPIRQYEPGSLGRKLAVLQPKHTLSLSQVLPQAVAAFSVPSLGSLVLITDGIGEGGSAWALPEAQRPARLCFISFQGAEQNANLMRDLARRHGGSFETVDSLAQTQELLARIRDEISNAANLTVNTDPPASTALQWTVYPGEPDGTRPVLTTINGPSLSLAVSPGLYWIKASDGTRQYGMRVFVPPDEYLREVLNLAMGRTKFTPLAKESEWSYSIQLDSPSPPPSFTGSATGSQVVELPQGYYRAELSFADGRKSKLCFHSTPRALIERVIGP